MTLVCKFIIFPTLLLPIVLELCHREDPQTTIAPHAILQQQHRQQHQQIAVVYNPPDVDRAAAVLRVAQIVRGWLAFHQEADLSQVLSFKLCSEGLDAYAAHWSLQRGKRWLLRGSAPFTTRHAQGASAAARTASTNMCQSAPRERVADAAGGAALPNAPRVAAEAGVAVTDEVLAGAATALWFIRYWRWCCCLRALREPLMSFTTLCPPTPVPVPAAVAAERAGGGSLVSVGVAFQP